MINIWRGQIFAKLMYFVVSDDMYMTLRKRRKASDREGFQMLHLEKTNKYAAKNNDNLSNTLDNFS